MFMQVPWIPVLVQAQVQAARGCARRVSVQNTLQKLCLYINISNIISNIITITITMITLSQSRIACTTLSFFSAGVCPFCWVRTDMQWVLCRIHVYVPSLHCSLTSGSHRAAAAGVQPLYYRPYVVEYLRPNNKSDTDKQTNKKSDIHIKRLHIHIKITYIYIYKYIH